MPTRATPRGCTVHWSGEEPLPPSAKPPFTSPEEPPPTPTLSTEAPRTHAITAPIPRPTPSLPAPPYQSRRSPMPTTDEDGREYPTEAATVTGFGSPASTTPGRPAPKVRESPYPANTTPTNPPITNSQPMTLAHPRPTVSPPCTLTLVGQIPGIMPTAPLCPASPSTIRPVRIRLPAPIPGATSAPACPPQIGRLLVAAGPIHLSIEPTLSIGAIRAVVTSTRTQTPESLCSGSHHGDCWACRL
ncbi:vegetative cell wall protein gp1-like [Selaginella moellendorffii]|uniref:vegetative cell wall protein gp1-like n=1 Tax=Selaginella moellendorffii TaxID=88036 RepID=UPI000D1CB21D|nr:vegetative cell wall protein gp1-like [Selaginella moellendorffii]|eukprot:XP_024523602.1 vegetative cell wall protein gp1-like [Selaginella moellendorffii]